MEATVRKTNPLYGPAGFVLALMGTVVVWRFGPFTPMQATLLTIAILFLFVLKRPVWAMCAFLLSHLTINNYMVTMPFGSSLSLRLLLLILIAVAVWFALGRRGIKLGSKAKPVLIAMTVLIALTIVANTINYPSMGEVFKDFRQMFIGLLIVILLPAVTRDLKDLKILCVTALIGISASAAIAIMQHYQFLDMQKYTLISGYVSRDFRMPGMAEDPLELSFVLSSGLPVLLSICLSKGSKVGTRLLLGVSAMLVGLAIYFTYTRSAALGVGVGVVAMIPFLGKRIRGPLVLAVLVAVLAVVLVGQVHGTRFVTQSDESAASRDVLRQAGIAIALDHPIFGIGAYDFESVSAQYASKINPAAMERSGAGQDLGQLQPHNDFVYLAACYGIPALLAFIVLLAAVALALRDSYRATSRPFIRALSIGLIGAIVAYLVNAYYHNCLTSMPLIWVLVGLALAVAKLSLNEKKMLRKT